MPRYYFHVHDGEDCPDLVGTELADDAAARAEAIVTAGSLLRELGSNFWGADWSMNVQTETGVPVCELRFSAKSPRDR